MAKRIGVILSGCGVMDGSEIHEAVFALMAIDKAGCAAVIMAPDAPQTHVVNHKTGEPEAGESRNCLVEAARIARGKIKPITQISVNDFDALVLPGGFGAAKNLCDYAFKGPEMKVRDDVTNLLKKAHAAGKPICATCISPVILARVFGDKQPALTIGRDAGTAKHIEEMGGRHVECDVKDYVYDEANKLVTTPAYMCNASISEVCAGIENAVVETILLLKESAKC